MTESGSRPSDRPSDPGDTGDIEPPLIDGHVHVFAPDTPFMSTAWSRPDYALTTEDYLHLLDAHGVHFGVVAAMSLAGDYNDYVVDTLRGNRRLRGTVYLAPSVRRAELRDYADAGIVGIRMFRSADLYGQVTDITTDEYKVFLRRIRDLDWHVQLTAAPDLIEATLAVLNEAGVKVIVDHFGRPDLELLEKSPQLTAILRSVDAGRTWIKISGGFRLTAASPPRTRADYLAARERERRLDTYLLAQIGTDRLVWGSDAPFVGHEGTVTYQDRLDTYFYSIPSGAVRRAIDRTAAKLYFG